MSWGKSKPEKFLDAVRENDISGAKKLWRSFGASSGGDSCDTWRQALDIAVRAGAEPMLKALLPLRTDGFYVVKSGDDTPVVTAWLTHAAKERNRLIWDALLTNNKPGGYGFHTPASLLLISMKADWTEVSQEIFTGVKAAAEGTSYAEALVASVSHSSHIFAEILQASGEIKNGQTALDAALEAAVIFGDADKIDTLVKRGAHVQRSEKITEMFSACLSNKDWDKAKEILPYGVDPNFDDGRFMRLAAAHNQQDLFDGLLSAGGNLSACGLKILTDLKANYASTPMMPYVENLITEACAEDIRQREEARYTLPDPYTLSYVTHLPDNICLTTLFNFQRCQQITIVKDTKGGQISVDTKGFEEVLNEQEIFRLREKFEARGGKIPAADIMANMIKKVALPSIGGGHGGS